MSDWRHRAICRGEDPELFFPVGSTGPAALQIVEAKAVCRQCPVTSDCLTFAMDNGLDHGIWGGLDENERRARKRRDAAVADLPSEPERRAAEDLLAGATIREVASRYGLSLWRAEKLSAHVRRGAPRPFRPVEPEPPLEVDPDSTEGVARQLLREGWTIRDVHQAMGVPRRQVERWSKRARESADAL